MSQVVWVGSFRGKPQMRRVIGELAGRVVFSVGGDDTRSVTRASFRKWCRRTNAARVKQA